VLFRPNGVIRAVIKYLCKKGMCPKEIHEDFMDTLEKESSSYSAVKKGAAEFRRGRESIGDDKQPSRLKKVTNDETDQKRTRLDI
jgi:hypothetical protein